MNCRRSSLIGGLCCFVLGSAFAVPGISIGIWTYSWGRDAQRVEGTVVRMVSTTRHNSKGRASRGSKPIVKYEVAAKSYEHESRISSSPPAYSVGQKVEVLYDPADPQVAVIDSFVDRWMFPLLFGGIGSLFALIGGGIIVKNLLRTMTSADPDNDQDFVSGTGA